MGTYTDFILAFVNSAIINISMYRSLCGMLNYTKLVRPYDKSIFGFLKNLHIVSIMTALIYLPNNGKSSFLHTFTSTCHHLIVDEDEDYLSEDEENHPS